MAKIRIIKKNNDCSMEYEVGDICEVTGTWYGGVHINGRSGIPVSLDKEENVDQVLGSQWSNDELQIIIGPAVADAYAEICEFGNLQREEAIDEDLDGNAEKKKVALKSVLMGIMDGISGCITPIIPMMIGGGMIKVFYMLANMVGILPETS